MNKRREIYRSDQDAHRQIKQDFYSLEVTLKGKDRELDENTENPAFDREELATQRRLLVIERAKLELEKAGVLDMNQFYRHRRSSTDDAFPLNYHVTTDKNRVNLESTSEGVAVVLLHPSAAPEKFRPKSKMLLEFPKPKNMDITDDIGENQFLTWIDEIPEVVITLFKLNKLSRKYTKSTYHFTKGSMDIVAEDGSVASLTVEEELALSKDIFIKLGLMSEVPQKTEII